MKKIISVIMSAAVLCAALVSCSQSTDSGKLQVYTSFYAMYDFARLIGGDRVEITNLVPAGAEAHDWEPSASDTAKISEGDVFIYNGNNMEHWADAVINVLPDDTAVVNASAGIEVKEENDPHVWLSPANALSEMEAIEAAFSEKDPENADYYRQNLEQCRSEIEALDAEYREAGLEGMKLIAAHEAYGYLCDEYGMEQISIDNGASEGDASPARMAEIVEYAKQYETKYIYYSPSEGSETADTAARDANCETLTLSAFENDEENRDYFTVMRENLENLKKNL